MPTSGIALNRFCPGLRDREAEVELGELPPSGDELATQTFHCGAVAVAGAVPRGAVGGTALDRRETEAGALNSGSSVGW